MFGVCLKCGEYRLDKIIEIGNGPGHAWAVCPLCGYKHFFLQLPLLIVSGASGAGKTVVQNHLAHRIREAVLLDSDILWSPAFDHPEDDYRCFFETWLDMCASISQGGRPVVLFGAGCGVPANLEPCTGRRFFSTLHYLALTCEDEVLRVRLRQRPAWRGCSEAFIQKQVEFNRWFKREAASKPPIALLDTTGVPLETTASQVAGWIHERVSLPG